MKKNGFALIEILTVTVVVMVIFTLLYSNLFPLIGEYEKRVGYTDVESQYISFYMRKLYKDKTINLGSSNYKLLYKNSSKSCALLSGSEKTKCEAIAEASGIVTMIVTKKDLTSLKAENLLAYSDLNELVDYIKYLPKYTNSDATEKYRLIIKTSTGYATTELKTTSSGMTAANTIIAKVGTDGLVAESHPTTTQLGATTDYRYTGKNPNNYISFNNEIWRIIGVFDVDDGAGNLEKRVKIIRESLGNMEWDLEYGGSFENDWTKATGMLFLNSGQYYNRTGTYASTGLTSDAKSMIENAKWYLGGTDKYNTTNASQFYSYERGTTVYTGRPTSWIGKLGLMYPSDYGYATSGGTSMNREACLTEVMYNWNASSLSDCKNNDWLYDSSIKQWTLTPASSGEGNAFCVISTGYVHFTDNVMNAHAFRPTVYLKSTVKITGGSGTSTSPYQIQN